ncbi:MAG TPA: FmdB family zinc ribbon protein [Limnobacter sp.]|nr:FmdB family zinc ribbon protein [Limnobacter sp.]
MPIYAYRCEACGFEKDVLQKLSDAPLTQCPSCKAERFVKQVTAAGFQLKGSGWYVTDFKSGGSTSSTSTQSKASSAETTASSSPSTPNTAAPGTDAA